MTTSLLPPNSTPLERALEGVINVEELLVPIDTIRDPWKCPVSFLALSAWENSVDVWNENWSELTKRKVVAASWEAHKYKGTVHGLNVALGALDFGVNVSQWFNYGGDPGYFKLDVDLFDRGITAEDQSDILAIADVSKRGSQHLDTLTIHQASQDNAPLVGCMVLSSEEILIEPYSAPELIQVTGAPNFAMTVQSVEEITIMPKEET